MNRKNKEQKLGDRSSCSMNNKNKQRDERCGYSMNRENKEQELGDRSSCSMNNKNKEQELGDRSG
jgi:hypothetical protein